jgi:hypothetical protein
MQQAGIAMCLARITNYMMQEFVAGEWATSRQRYGVY